MTLSKHLKSDEAILSLILIGVISILVALWYYTGYDTPERILKRNTIDKDMERLGIIECRGGYYTDDGLKYTSFFATARMTTGDGKVYYKYIEEPDSSYVKTVEASTIRPLEDTDCATVIKHLDWIDR